MFHHIRDGMIESKLSTFKLTLLRMWGYFLICSNPNHHFEFNAHSRIQSSSSSSCHGGASGVMVIVVGNGHGDTSSNPGRDWLHFT